MPWVLRNERAGQLIRDLRSDKGLSPEGLAYEIYRDGKGAVSARTIRRVEAIGMVPRVGAQFALASYFGRSVSQIWSAATTRRVEIERDEPAAVA